MLLDNHPNRNKKFFKKPHFQAKKSGKQPLVPLNGRLFPPTLTAPPLSVVTTIIVFSYWPVSFRLVTTLYGRNVRTSYFHQHHNSGPSGFTAVQKLLSFWSLTWSFPYISCQVWECHILKPTIASNLVHRVVKSANHGRIEVAELILVVADILLVAVRYLQRDSEWNLVLRFSKGKARSKTIFDTSWDPCKRKTKLSKNSFKVWQFNFFRDICQGC